MNSKLSKILDLIKKKDLNLAERECINLVSEDGQNHEYFNIYAIVCFQMEKYNLAIKNWQKSTEINSKYYFGYNNIGKAYLNLKKYDEALNNFNKTISIQPNFFEAYNNKGNVLTKLGKPDEAINNYNIAIKIKPENISSYILKAHILSQIDRLDESLENYEIAYKINPNYPLLLGYILNIKSQICNWKNYDENLIKLSNGLEKNIKITFPFTTLVLLDSPAIQKKASEIWSKGYEVPIKKINAFSKIKNKKKIKLGYFTADFRNHATSHLTSEMFENHDKSKFETYGFYLGNTVNENDIWHQRIKKSFNEFYFVNKMSDLEISNLVINLNIDIAIDLMTHCTNGMENRFGVFSRKCAPIQVNFLGYPGTSGSKAIDYIIADRVVIPEKNKSFFSEEIIYMPNSYQPNSKNFKVSNKKYIKDNFNLPSDKIILCCFNQHQKITPKIFKIWMNILKKNSNTVLWLLQDNKFSKKNLIYEAERAQVQKDRLIFSDRISIENHLERIKLADLFLDTYPYSAHTTCSDAIRSGLPVVTLMGESFASRVASSLLKTTNLDELITMSYDEYENLINNLINNSSRLERLKLKVKNNAKESVLYNSKIYTKHIEEAFMNIINNLKNN
tara:strand:- start:678 stop:2534 length:1857 start_codon:yes stop_codon:yes gene_type:complete